MITRKVKLRFQPNKDEQRSGYSLSVPRKVLQNLNWPVKKLKDEREILCQSVGGTLIYSNNLPAKISRKDLKRRSALKKALKEGLEEEVSDIFLKKLSIEQLELKKVGLEAFIISYKDKIAAKELALEKINRIINEKNEEE